MTDRRPIGEVNEAVDQHEQSRATAPRFVSPGSVGMCCIIVDELIALRADIKLINNAVRSALVCGDPYERGIAERELGVILDAAMERV